MESGTHIVLEDDSEVHVSPNLGLIDPLVSSTHHYPHHPSASTLHLADDNIVDSTVDSPTVISSTSSTPTLPLSTTGSRPSGISSSDPNIQQIRQQQLSQQIYTDQVGAVAGASFNVVSTPPLGETSKTSPGQLATLPIVTASFVSSISTSSPSFSSSSASSSTSSNNSRTTRAASAAAAAAAAKTSSASSASSISSASSS
ncbi:unnamed protein product [Protopolystoma xenopodis]|uniref:Uncharacterized protein n=1 Tax=Protopolystoma xenopodis TaxID=117903 RepID=A0A3S5A3F2_9PLAT|nr:unnamed protein product [Protopolystoma xenopodis]